MIMMHKIRSILALAFLILSPSVTWGQISPEMIQKARQAGATDAQIQAALSGMNTTNNQSIQQNRTAISDTASGRKELDSAMLAQVNPDVFQHRDSMTGRQIEYEIVWENDKFVRRPIPLVFGQEMFQNKNLTFAPNYNMATPPSYVLGAGDEIVVEVWGPSEFEVKQRISPDGTINIQGIGLISLNGLTMAEAQNRIANKVSSVMGGANVKVSLGQIRSIKVNIAGEVMVPGTYTLPSLASVFNAIYSAGGVNRIGSLRAIKVYRDSKEIATLDVYDYLINGKYETNIRLEDNDMIIVQPYDSYVTVTGKVKRPRIYEMKKDETLGDLFKYAGGFTGDAYNDNVNVKRKTGRQYSILTVDNPDFAEFTVADGDSVIVDRIFDEFANRVVIRGAVWRPGDYELSERTNTLSKLIARAEGLKGNEFAHRGQITRLKSDYTYEIIPFDVREAATGAQDIELMREDSIYIPTILDLREAYTITIGGEVNRPDTLEYRDGMTVEDAILMAGGLKESASYAMVEIARRIKDPKSTSYTDKRAEIYTFSINDMLQISPEAERFVLHPFDEIYVRRSPGYGAQERVFISGEILFDGNYVLATAGERLSDVIKKAGGFTPEAYVKGASVKRRLTDDERIQVESLLKMTRESRTTSGRDSAAFDNVEILDYYPVGVDIVAALNNPGCSEDIVLRDGDQIFVPKYNGTVKISGAVNYPNSVVFTKSKLKEYISQAGGYKQVARRRPFVIYMNGQVASTRTGFFCKRYPKIEPGCQIIVPQKIIKEGRGMAGVMSMVTSTASLAAVIASLVRLAN